MAHSTVDFVEFRTFGQEGLTLETNQFGASFFVLTGFHGTHVAVGVLIDAGVGMEVICLIFAAYAVASTGLIWAALRGVPRRHAAA